MYKYTSDYFTRRFVGICLDYFRMRFQFGIPALRELFSHSCTLLAPILFLQYFALTISHAGDLKTSDSAYFDIQISGKNIDKESNSFELFSLTTQKNTPITHRFKSRQGKQYELMFKYKPLPDNRSYPGNLDITLSDSKGQKIGYLFFATNGIRALKSIGVFGLRVGDGNNLIDVRFIFDRQQRSGSLQLTDLSDERFVQDTLIPSEGFQMIRPVILDKDRDSRMYKAYALDSHPFEVSYSAVQMSPGIVEFRHNLNTTSDQAKPRLLQTYYRASSQENLRSAMFASKYFDSKYGAIKLVFYPALGQTEP